MGSWTEGESENKDRKQGSKRENRHQHGRGDERRENNENKEMEKGETAMGYRLETEDKQDGTGEQDRSHTSM